VWLQRYGSKNWINFEFSIGNDVDFEVLITNVGFDNNLVAILTQEDGFQKMRIRTFSPENKECWGFKFNEFEKAIRYAKNVCGITKNI
jgi:hypothetical protein